MIVNAQSSAKGYFRATRLGEGGKGGGPRKIQTKQPEQTENSTQTKIFLKAKVNRARVLAKMSLHNSHIHMMQRLKVSFDKK